MTPPRYAHQDTTVTFCAEKSRVLNFSDPGTGKTRAHLDAYAARAGRKRALVFAPLSILEPAWGADIRTYQPGLRYAVADAKNRKEALYSDADVVLCNHDGAKAVAKLSREDKYLLADFDELIVDEATAFKNLAGRGGSARAQSLSDIRHRFDYRRILTGTPASNTILDIWALAFLADDGERLGASYFAFRNQVTTPYQVGPSSQMIEWREKPGALDNVSLRLADITIRFRKQDCVDIPPNHVFTVPVTLPKRVLQVYNEMLRESVAMMSDGRIVNALHAGARAQKLLQICTGAVYDESGEASVIDTERPDLIADLVDQRPWPCVIVFNWRHQRAQITDALERRHIGWAVIDGSTPPSIRTNIVNDYQAGRIRALLIHPQSAAHGLTLTAGRTTIWASPTANAEHFLQANARIDRNGQKHETETILIAANGTREERVYEMLQGKVDRVHGLLELLLLKE